MGSMRRQRNVIFYQREIAFLGYRIGPQGVEMEAAKVKAVQQWPEPKSVKALQSFLGFANFYRRFIRGFSTVAAPLTSLLKGKPQPLHEFPLEACAAFQLLKLAFTSAPIVKLLDPEKPFLVEVDASEVGLGAVLSQR
ncbi:uncharacterized protein LOC128528108 [Clarias gariepinus]|uniref:uncharacterized protein LOC128528108 n=1 Tax=Clarias gariepinus TaxID=13013 RepID=UPI00234C96B0|nr:uncharacterized protein LOC128528108 [Clarias gariepinus]